MGRFFNSFGLVIAFAILMSLFVSLTMTPMLCSRFLRLEDIIHGTKSGIVWRMIESSYMIILRYSMTHRSFIVFISIGLICLTPWLFTIVGLEFVPRDDQGEFQVAILLPEGYSLERGDFEVGQLEQRFRSLPGVTHTFTVIGDTTSRLGKGQGDISTANIYVRIEDLAKENFRSLM